MEERELRGNHIFSKLLRNSIGRSLNLKKIIVTEKEIITLLIFISFL